MNRLLTTAAAAAGAANTLNALHPLGRGKAYRAVASFAAGLPTSEFPLPIAAAQLTGAVALRRSMTVPGAFLTGASLSGLAYQDFLSRKAEGILDRAMADAFGADYRSRVRHPRPAPERTPGVLETWRAHPRYTGGSADVSYGPAGHRNMLDVWRRPDLHPNAKAPVLVQIHGGGWMTGDRTVQAYPLMSLMAELGWVCVSVSYRLSPRETWPAQLDDVKAAIRWVQKNISTYGGDPEFVCVTGGSAGGHLTMLASLDPELNVKASAPYYGPPDFTNREGYEHDLLGPALAKKIIKRPLDDDTRELYSLASPHDQIHADAPPFLVLGAELDNLVSPTDLRNFARELKATSRQPVAFAELPGAWHAWDLWATRRARVTARTVADFLGLAYAGAGAVSSA